MKTIRFFAAVALALACANGAWAGETAAASVTTNGVTTFYATLTNAWADAIAYRNVDVLITMLQDATIESTLAHDNHGYGGILTLDLNGHVLAYAGATDACVISQSTGPGLDGRILPCETRAFWQLVQRCPAYTPECAQVSFERGMRGAGYLVAIGQPGVFTRAQRVEAFVSEALKTLRASGLGEAMKNPVKAFAIWTAMACVDKDFSDIEQMGLRALCERFATLYVKKET